MPEASAEGVILAQGGAFAGWSLYAKMGANYCCNLLGLQRFKIEGDAAIPSERTRCAWSSPTTAAAPARAALSRFTSTATRPVKAASRQPCR